MTWTGEQREFHQKGRKHTLCWTIRVDGATETTTHGVLKGTMQETSHTYGPINVGKSNEVSAEDYALDRALRKLTDRKKPDTSFPRLRSAAMKSIESVGVMFHR